MKTYIIMYFNSNGEKPSEVIKKLRDLGFSPVRGDYDLMYEWDDETSLEQIMSIGDKLRELLKGDDVLFQIETSEGDNQRGPEEGEMKTCMKILFPSNKGQSPSRVDNKITDLVDIGFEPIKGEYDYIYRWSSSGNMEATIEIADRVYEALQGCSVYFKLKTV